MKTIVRPNLNPLALPKLALAGRAVLTFRNLQAGTHMTLKIKRARDKQDPARKSPVFWVSASLLGDGAQSYEFVGTLFADTMRVKLGRGVSNESRLGRVMAFLVSSLRNPASLNGRVGLFHEGRCMSCGRELTHPESITTGIGPECIKRMKREDGDFDIAALFSPIS